MFSTVGARTLTIPIIGWRGGEGHSDGKSFENVSIGREEGRLLVIYDGIPKGIVDQVVHNSEQKSGDHSFLIPLCLVGIHHFASGSLAKEMQPKIFISTQSFIVPRAELYDDKSGVQ